ncbi:Hypothetical predicted protein, partial [Pelobates cultripes]
AAEAVHRKLQARKRRGARRHTRPEQPTHKAHHRIPLGTSINPARSQISVKPEPTSLQILSRDSSFSMLRIVCTPKTNM